MTVTFVYLLSSIMLLNIWKISLEWIMILNVAKFWANLDPNYPIASKGDFFFFFFGKLTKSLLSTDWAPIILHLKQILRADH